MDRAADDVQKQIFSQTSAIREAIPGKWVLPWCGQPQCCITRLLMEWGLWRCKPTIVCTYALEAHLKYESNAMCATVARKFWAFIELFIWGAEYSVTVEVTASEIVTVAQLVHYGLSSLPVRCAGCVTPRW